MGPFHYLAQTLHGSDGCPARCGFCDLADRENSSLELKATAPSVKGQWIQNWILLLGGDQYRFPQLNESIQTFQSQGYRVAVVTSGLLFKDRPADQFDKADLTLLPVFSHQASQHNFEMGVDSFERILEIGKILKRKKKLVILNQMISRESMPYLDDIADFWQQQELFCILRPRSALVDVPGLDRETRAMLQYQAQKKHLFLLAGDVLNLIRKSDPARLQACLAGEAWQKQSGIRGLVGDWDWHRLINKAQNYKGSLIPSN